MHKLLTIVSAAFLFAACNSGEEKKDETKTEQPTASSEWVSLFDGTSLKGWHKYGGAPAGAAWKVSDSAIYLDTTVRKDGKLDGGDLVTDEEYGDFHLKLEWKIAPGGNSGIIFYTKEDTSKYKTSYATGPEMQVVDNEGHPDGKFEKHKAGDLYDMIASSKIVVKPAGEWNLAEIKSEKGKLDLYLNGENVVSTTMWDDNWKKLIDGSKFKGWEGFGTFKQGHIVLQDHGNGVWYKNIVIKKL